MGHEEANPEDIQLFIEEFQRLMAGEEVPPGYQSKFAKVIAELQQKKLVKIAIFRDILRRHPKGHVNAEVMLQTLLTALNDPSSKAPERFDAAFKLAQLRADISADATQKRAKGVIPPKDPNSESGTEEQNTPDT